MPEFGPLGDGSYKLQPVHADDSAEPATRADGNAAATCGAVWPETFEYLERVALIARTMGVRRLVLGLPAGAARALARLLRDCFRTAVAAT